MKSLAFVPFRAVYAAVRARLGRFATNQSGNVAVLTALALPALIGATGLGVEASYWYLTQRSMQNAADSAVIAAATNGTGNYKAEAKAAAAKYGFVDGVNNISVVASNTASCPAGGANCYSATITGYVPLFLSQVAGYKGEVVGNGPPQTKLSATAVARLDLMPREYCVLALGTEGIAFGSNGAPKADLAGCSIMSNAGARCNGNNLGADYGDAAGKNEGCGVVQRSNVPPLADPYAGLRSNIPPDPCGGMYSKMGSPNFPAANTWHGTVTLGSGPYNVCGDLVLGSDVTIHTPPQGAVLVIWNGQLYTGKKPNGRTLRTDANSALTIVFTGTNAAGYTHTPTGDGTLDFAAPTTGPWKGIAIYQDPNLTTGVNITEAGNTPTWKITGMVYLPHSSVTLSGVVDKSSDGKSCFGLVVDNLTINGTGAIMAHGGCAEAGVDLPTGTAPTGRGALVL
ncbi:pilus assembly protein TadG-related protein [Microvirga terricola]|uniref:Pilus assembly protein n=1 Tax=Microvirga terricola TaxID=2719797 RepID=A0ABX0VEW1_9HYPH|nr:TadE/TadG family type IV pilus assembly protein [Microvirga terricola]NIX78377.1 pilus assembly protein [Microvirga terricola]